MSTPEPWPDAGPTLSEDAATGQVRMSRTNQPWRALLAVGEIVVAVLLGWLAWALWGRGIVHIRLPGGGGAPEVITRMFGSWLSLAVLVGTVGGLLVLDSLRQSVLALGTGRRRKARQRSR